MGSQAASGVIFRQDLTELAEEITFEELNLTAEKIATTVPVDDVAGQWPVLPRESRMKVPDTRRHEDGTYTRGQWEWNKDTYTTFEYGFEEPVDNVSQIVNKKYINQEEISTELSMEGVMLARESRVATALFNETTFATGLVTVTNEWDDPTNAVPYANIQAAYIALRAKCGLSKGNFSLIISDDLVDFFFRTDEVVNGSKYVVILQTMPRAAKLRWMAEYFGIKEVVETHTLYDTTGLAQGMSIGKFWSNEYAMLALLAPPTRSMKARGVIRQVAYSPITNNVIVESYDEPAKNGMVIRAREYRGIKTNADYGVLLKNMKTTVSSGI